MTAVAVKVLDTDFARNLVFGVKELRSPRSANPYPFSKTTAPSFTTRTLAPGAWKRPRLLDMKPSMKAVNSWGSSAAGFNLGDALVVAATPPLFSTRDTAMSPTRRHAITRAGRVSRRLWHGLFLALTSRSCGRCHESSHDDGINKSCQQGQDVDDSARIGSPGAHAEPQRKQRPNARIAPTKERAPDPT